MKEAIQLQLTKPCHENWNAMTTNEQGRYCQSCCKTVVDFSILSDREILEYISGHAGGDTCARVGDNQLNRIIATPRERKTGWKYFWTMAISSLLLSYRSLAQVQPPKNMTMGVAVGPGTPGESLTGRIGGVSYTPATHVDFEIHGRIADENGDPVPFATIVVKNSRKHIAADSAGCFVFRANDMLKLEMSVSAVGYEEASIVELAPRQVKSIDISNRQANIWMTDITLKPQVMGLTKITIVRKDVRPISDTIRGWMGSDIKIYPNPVPVNSSFYVKLNVKTAGEYNIQFVDASGRIVGGKRVTIAQKGQMESFPATTLQGHGVYFIRVINKDGKVYSSKLEVL